MHRASHFHILAFKLVSSFVVARTSLECDLYLAESTLPNAGLGIFTAVEKKAGDTVGNGDVAFPLLDMEWHNSVRNLVQKSSISFDNEFGDYIWDGVEMGMGRETDDPDISALWPGLDCSINCLQPLENVGKAFPQHLSHGDHLPYMPHSKKDPGAGAITTYRDGKTHVSRDIPPGGELFKNYGDDWFITRPWVFNKGFPVSTSFVHAQNLIEVYAERFNFPPLYETILDIRQIWTRKSRSLNALPDSIEQLPIALEKGIGELYQKNATRSLDWLQEHGTCIDHIVHRESNIPGAGEGAFAKRNLPKGTVITGSPLMIIPDGSIFDMFEADYGENGLESASRFSRQIIFNYCFGHEDTTVLLFPYAAIGVHYINHNSSRANVKIQWAEPGKLGHNATFLELTPREIHELGPARDLGIIYVATEDIAEGDEIFLDYGATWEEAWEDHVKHWRPPADDTIAADWNERTNEPIRTDEERKSNPYPRNVEVRCHAALLLDENWRTKTSWPLYGDADDAHYSVYGLRCDILDRSEDGTTYEVLLFKDDLTFVDFSTEEEEDGIPMAGVPREAIFFLDASYQSDLYLEGAFRHHIRIPDEMLPDAWRNNRLPQHDGPTRKSSVAEEL